MSRAIATHELEELIACFIDDLATGGDSHEQAAEHARKLFSMLEDFHLLAGADKVIFWG